MKNSKLAVFIAVVLLLINTSILHAQKSNKQVFEDIQFSQDYSIKFYSNNDSQNLQDACSDRNGNIQLLGANGLFKTHNGQFLYPGTIVVDETYRTLSHKKFEAVASYKNQFVYLDILYLQDIVSLERELIYLF